MAKRIAQLSASAAEYWRGDAEYERARQSAVWNAKKPDRFPDVIVAAGAEQDVVAAVKFARTNGFRVAVRAGGHSWCASPVRDKGMLVDLSRFRRFSIDPARRVASVQPAVTGSEFARGLAERDLAFPVGHCGSVPMSGYLLCGGFGWNVGTWGPACFSLERIEVVTAGGDLVIADASHNADLFWAARGAGPGFFGVATRFDVRLQTLPKAIMTSAYFFPITQAEEVSSWVTEVAPKFPPNVELILLVSTPPGPPAAPADRFLGLIGAAFADTEDEARQALQPLKGCPGLSRAVMRQEEQHASIDMLHSLLAQLLPEQHRYLADTFWFNRGLAEILPRIARAVAGAPSRKSLVIAPIRRPPPAGAQMPAAAFSMVSRTFLLCYAIWEAETDDAENERWMRSIVGEVEADAIGHYVAEADLAVSPSRSVKSFAPANWSRLQELRKTYDPQNLFFSYLGLE